MSVFDLPPKQRRFRAACIKCSSKYDFKVSRDREGYTKEQIKYFKERFVCKLCLEKEKTSE